MSQDPPVAPQSPAPAGPRLTPLMHVITLYPPRCTRALLIVIAVYYAMVMIAGGPDDPAVILAFGANYGPFVADGDLWRLVTAIFLHASLAHLFVNLISLYFMGRFLEAFHGPWGLLFLFLGSGVSGSIASAVVLEHISVGASGGVFGLLGAAAVFTFRYRKHLPLRVKPLVGPSFVPWVFFVALAVLNLGVGSLVPMIDNRAHLGGLIFGAVASLVVPAPAVEQVVRGRRRELPRFVASICLSLLLVSFFFAGRNIFRLRGEGGAILDPRLTTTLGNFDPEEMMQVLNEALRRDPNDAELLGLRAQLHTAAGRWQEAIRDYRAALAIDSDDATALNNVAWILLEEAPSELRDREEAERLVKRALMLEPDNPYVLGTYGTARLRAGDFADAARNLARALESPRSPREAATDRFLLAIALARSGRPDEAREELRKATAADPENVYRSEAEDVVRAIVPSG
jgi:rhomboid protease GluP